MDPTEAGAVDVAASIADARRLWRDAGDDLLSQELFATHAVLGELLLTGPGDDPEAYVTECHDLIGRLIELGDQIRRRDDQQFALWIADTTTDRG